MNEMLRKRMSATQQASEQQTGDAAYEPVSYTHLFLKPLGRFPTVEEDEPPYRLLCTEYPKAD